MMSDVVFQANYPPASFTSYYRKIPANILNKQSDFPTSYKLAVDLYTKEIEW